MQGIPYHIPAKCRVVAFHRAPLAGMLSMSMKNHERDNSLFHANCHGQNSTLYCGKLHSGSAAVMSPYAQNKTYYFVNLFLIKELNVTSTTEKKNEK